MNDLDRNKINRLKLLYESELYDNKGLSANTTNIPAVIFLFLIVAKTVDLITINPPIISGISSNLNGIFIKK